MTAQTAVLEQKITELEQQVAVLTRLVEVNTVLNAALLSSSLKVEALLGYIMDAAAQITDSEAASILLWKHTTQELFFAATTTDNEYAKALLGKPVPLDSIAGTILREKRPVRVEDVNRDPRHYDQVDQDIQFVTRSLLGVPMISKHRVIGVLEVVNKRQLPWTEQNLQHMTLLADEAAVAIEVAQLVVALQKANTDLNELDTLKSNFIAIASHELRTPLGVILGYASFLQEEATSPYHSELAAKVTSSALQLREIIDGMINLRYLKQSEGELSRETVPLRALLNALETEARTLIEAHQHTLTVEYPPDDEISLYIDQTRIDMALHNLMNNAMRFTPQGGTIRVTWQVRAGEAWISIHDNGIGIEKPNLERIFEEFYQVEDHMTRRHGGLGIGLSIARALVGAHGGRIWAESAGVNQGATFTISLPLAK
jgi:signal transduction histidine kinase